MSKEHFEVLFKTLVTSVLGVVAVVGTLLTLTGKVSPWTGRFYSLLDPSYAKNHIPIIASVSEHQPTSWSSFYFDLQVRDAIKIRQFACCLDYDDVQKRCAELRLKAPSDYMHFDR